VLALLVIAIAMGRGLAFIADWGPFLLLFLAYEAMRGFAAKTGFAANDLSGLEKTVFGGLLPTMTLQHAFYNPNVVSPQDLIATFFYFMHFPLPILVGFIFWWSSRDHYRRYVAALLLLCFLAFITYLFWPSAPPWWQYQGDVYKIINRTVDSLWGSQYYVSTIYQSFNPNQFAAFPSLHAAFPALGAVYAWHRFRKLSIALIAWSIAVLLSIVYLGEHYVVDAVAGYVYVAAATLLVEGFVRWRARTRPVKPTPATPSA
jgi:membrane-associated phospholipid phosphatase